jgi:hypothetical protein
MKSLTISRLRESFWQAFPSFAHERRSRKRQNDYNATIRCYWVDFVDAEHRNGGISDSVASRATL